jgi:transposase
VGSVAGGRSCRATAALFGVSVASVVKWSRRFRATGSAAAKKMGGWRQLLLKSEREWLLARIAEKPDLTLRAVVAELGERGTPASYGAVWRFFKHEGITFKKSLFASEQDRADVARLAALRCDRITAPCVIDGPINGTSFRAGACPGEGRGRAISSSPR